MQHPLGDAMAATGPMAPVRSPHTSYRWRGHKLVCNKNVEVTKQFIMRNKQKLVGSAALAQSKVIICLASTDSGMSI